MVILFIFCFVNVFNKNVFVIYTSDIPVIIDR
jgi:hypothetical protein